MLNSASDDDESYEDLDYKSPEYYKNLEQENILKNKNYVRKNLEVEQEYKEPFCFFKKKQSHSHASLYNWLCFCGVIGFIGSILFIIIYFSNKDAQYKPSHNFTTTLRP